MWSPCELSFIFLMALSNYSHCISYGFSFIWELRNILFQFMCFFYPANKGAPSLLSLLKFLFFFSNQTVILVLFSVLFCNILFYICNTVRILFFSISLFFLFLWFKGTLRIWRSFFFIFWLLVYFLNSNYIFW